MCVFFWGWGFVCFRVSQNPAGQLMILGDFIAEYDSLDLLRMGTFALQIVKRLHSLVHI